MSGSLRWLVTTVLTVAVVNGCQTREAGEDADAPTDTSSAAGGMDEGGGEAAGPDARAALLESADRWEKGALAGDAAAVASLYSEDAVLLAPGVPTAKGRAQIESALAAMFESAPATSVSIDSDAITVSESGDLAYDVGTYTMAGTTPAGEAWQDEGKYLAVLRNVGGEWKLVADTWNSDAPPAM